MTAQTDNSDVHLSFSAGLAFNDNDMLNVQSPTFNFVARDLKPEDDEAALKKWADGFVALVRAKLVSRGNVPTPKNEKISAL